jgi:hypothetical protein
MMRSNGADMAGEPLPSVLEMLPAAPEGLWQWKWAGFKAGRWYSGGAMSWVRSSQTVLNCDVAATAERVTIRITDQDQRPVTGARVMLRVTEDSNSNAIADTEAFSALFTGAKPYSVSASSVILARCYSGMAWKMLRWSACVYRNPPAIGDFSLQIKNNLRRRGLRRCCGGCGFGRESQLMAVDPLALWRPWVVTSDDGVISERFVWPTPFPDAMKITVIAISGDRIGQACGTLRGDWTPPN